MSDLIHYDAMRRELAAAHRIDEVKDIRDKALALEQYVRLAQDTEAERQCIEIRLRAERRAGELLKASKASGERADERGSNGGVSNDTTPTLTDLGVSRDQSSRWQRLADVPDETFEGALASEHSRPSTAGILRLHESGPPLEPMQVDPKSLWIWGRLRDFQRYGHVDGDPAAQLAGMSVEMRADVAEALPTVIDWLQQLREKCDER